MNQTIPRFTYRMETLLDPQVVVDLDRLAEMRGTSRAAEVRAAINLYRAMFADTIIAARKAEVDPTTGYRAGDTVLCVACSEKGGQAVPFDEAWRDDLRCSACGRELVMAW